MAANKKITCRRYYYNSHNGRSFEQSLDVYKPAFGVTAVQKKELPLVVLVVGSAWLGHRSIIYAATSWWNSSGPRAFAKQGCVTVCIRHRGSFPRVAEESLTWMASILAVGATVYWVLADSSWEDDRFVLFSALVVVMSILVGWALLALGARGAADFEDMVRDVADALYWVQKYRATVYLRIPGDTSPQQKLVFGGYSSGGHTAAALMQRPKLLEARGLPKPEELFDAALFISGVLAVRPPKTTTNAAHPSTWLTDLVTRVVFGKQGASRLPSPLHTLHKQPRIPHVLIGCIEEVFGLPWMDVFFCSRDFCQSLRRYGVPARLVEVNSDHWNILGSRSLSSVLGKELEWILRQR